MQTQGSTAGYGALRDQVEGLLSEGKVHGRQAREWQKVETYWHIGDAMLRHLDGQPRAEYGHQVIRSLSNDTGLAYSTLGEILLFRRSVPIPSTSRQLGWSHVREVLRAPTHDQRLYYLRAADEGNWSVRQLREAVRADAYGRHTENPWVVSPDADLDEAPTLQANFGQLYTYAVVSPGTPGDDEPHLDLGFGLACPTALVGLQGLHPGQTVTVAGRPGTRRYTYVAWPQRIIDGDTLIAIVDLGFGLKTRPQRFRLNGIDCPELGTQAGRNARTYTERALSQVDFVVITTHRTDSYGRYLADVRYLPGEADPEAVRRSGRYLNRELLDQRLAWRYVR